MRIKYLYRLIPLLMFLGVFIVADGLQAHKPVTSKYTYYKDIQPLFRFYCGGCHVAEGIAPMSLLTYREAFPWAESIKEHLLAESMHPWHDDESYGLFTHDQRMTPRQLDMIIDWASGGTPEGTQSTIAAAAMETPEWILGTPDLLLPMPAPVTVEADIADKTVDIRLSSGLSEAQWLTAIDLKPGYPGIVHNAIVYLGGQEPGAESRASADIPAERILGVWIPGRIPAMTEDDAFLLPADAPLMLRLHYRKTWRDEGMERTDRSTLGLYFAPQPPPQTIRTLILEQTAEPGQQTDELRIEQTFAREIILKGLTPGMSPAGQSIQAAMKTADGEEIELLRIATYDQGWPMRYEFREPVYAPRGSRIIISGTYDAGAEETEGSDIHSAHKLKIWLDYTL